jgi:AcrR family transcriptional regulator
VTTDTATEGLRERKKRATREAIAAAARRLFAERGFDAVTVAEVARAADVAEKTVFNHFPTKEDLVFPDGAERQAALMDAIRGRPPGASVVEPFRRWTDAFLDRVAAGDVQEFLAVAQVVMHSAAVRNRLFLAWEEEAAWLAPLIAEAAGADAGRPVPQIVARTLAWTHRGIFRAALVRLMAGEDPRRVARDLRSDARAAYDLLEGGLGGYGVRLAQDGA